MKNPDLTPLNGLDVGLTAHNSECPVPAVSKETASTQIAEIIHVKNNGIEYKLLE